MEYICLKINISLQVHFILTQLHIAMIGRLSPLRGSSRRKWFLYVSVYVNKRSQCQITFECNIPPTIFLKIPFPMNVIFKSSSQPHICTTSPTFYTITTTICQCSKNIIFQIICFATKAYCTFPSTSSPIINGVESSLKPW